MTVTMSRLQGKARSLGLGVQPGQTGEFHGLVTVYHLKTGRLVTNEWLTPDAAMARIERVEAMQTRSWPMPPVPARAGFPRFRHVPSS
jgi:hypothetical protein